MIPYGRQEITQNDIDAVVEVLKSDFLTQGPKVPEFENLVKTYCSVNHAVAVNSATSALHIACLALGLEKGDYLWTSPITFVASANCALYCGAKVDFVDIDIETYNLSAEKLEQKLILARQQDKLPKIVVAVHLCGKPCDMQAIYKLGREYGFKIIEDAAHAIGGRYQGKPIGSCEYSDITVFSFHPVKIITTGEGGIAVTNNVELASKMALLRSHGITRDAGLMNKNDGNWYYEQLSLGYNYRMTDIHAALGISQFNRLDEYVARRHELAHRYDDLLADLPLSCPQTGKNEYSGLHLYVVLLDVAKLNKTRKEIFNALREKGIGVNIHYIPVHTQPYYNELGFKTGDFPEAENYYSKAISLPLFPTMTLSEQDMVISAVKESVSG